jgi:hypothetical protein
MLKYRKRITYHKCNIKNNSYKSFRHQYPEMGAGEFMFQLRLIYTIVELC